MQKLDNYTLAEVSSISQAELESRALLRTASTLFMIQENWEEKKEELNEALEKNRKLWTILSSYANEEDAPQPPEVRQNITNLALFIFKKTLDIMLHPTPESLSVLININRTIAKGLSSNPNAQNQENK